MAGLKKARRAKQRQTAKAQQYLDRSMSAQRYPTAQPPAAAPAHSVSTFVMTTDDMAGTK
jgi:hypothetical protein